TARARPAWRDTECRHPVKRRGETTMTETRSPDLRLATRTVGDLARDPRAREVLDRLHVNHCCGAHLSIEEAAAAAGVTLASLMDEIDAVRTTTIDVRGLEPPQPLVRILGALDTLADGDRLGGLIGRGPVLLYPQLDARGFSHVTEEREPGQFRIVITSPARA